jgi:hypothetical protein
VTASTLMQHHGFGVTLPPAWDGAIYVRPPVGGESTNPVVHAASFALPAGRGDFGGGAVEVMGPDDVFVAVVSYDAASAGAALFAHHGPPAPLTLGDFSPRSLQRQIPGQAGVQRFFVLGGRPLCLYVVLGSYPNGPALIPPVNRIVSGLSVDAPADGTAG